MKQSNNNIPRI